MLGVQLAQLVQKNPKAYQYIPFGGSKIVFSIFVSGETIFSHQAILFRPLPAIPLEQCSSNQTV